MSGPFDFSAKAVLITGGSRGIGRGIAEAFLDAGADVAVSGRKEPDELPSGGGKRALFIGADVRDPKQVEAMIDKVVQRWGRLDVLVNNAGGAPFTEAATASPRFSEKVIQLNLIAALHGAQQANRVMQGQDTGGVIINVASVSGVRPSPGTAAYGAAKAGLINLTGSLAIEWGPKVRVNAVSPGMIKTEQAHLHYGDAAGIARVADTVPLKRLGTPEDVAGACLYLASPLASYVSGANLVLHGGGETPAFLTAANIHRGE
ncbi:MAG: SDR family oxidoreductase [Myxococcales bacterium]|nr:SDR family oxidoreductase [Myxococcales bacterium]MDH3484269.1 SDR family oxidoreductase [Myxococcales bacterium]